jgi:Tol biopolymer transport system component
MAAPGTRLGPYEIVGLIGAGGMGEVYRARDPRLGREVAIKILPARFATDSERLRRFEQEARAAAALSDPHILAIYDLGTQPNGAPYIVSELLEGETLRDRLRSGPLPARKATEYAVQIARGLAAAHEKRIVHRDLKPENVFLTTDGRAKLLDFGLAKLTERSLEVQTSAPTEGRTDPGTVLGTVGYMAPEQVRGHETDHRGDIFSLGAILYEMLSGRRAFRGETGADTLSAILNDDPPGLTETNGAVPPAMERIVRHCLEKKPEERFQSARDIAFDLEALAAASSSATASHANAVRATRAGTHARFAAAALLGALVVGAVGFWVGARRAKPVIAEYRQITFRRGSIGNARFGPDGRTVFYDASWEGAPQEIYAGRTDSLGERGMGLAGSVLVATSSAGEMAVRTNTTFVGGFPGLVSVVPTAGGAPRPLLEDTQEIDWSSDGRQMAVVRWVRQKEAWRLEYPTGKVLVEGRTWLSNIRVSPDGRHVAFFDHGNSVGDNRGDVAVVDLDGRKTVISTGWASLLGLDWSPRGDELWFTAARDGLDNIYAATLKGELRGLATMPAQVSIQDVGPDGKVLLKKQQFNLEIYGGNEGEPAERKLNWLDWSMLRGISDDGRYVLFDEQGAGGGPDYTVYIRPTDGGPAVALGRGVAVAISPDNRWVLSATTATPTQFVLLPTGAGEPRRVTDDSIDHINARFLPDGKRVLFSGREPGHGSRLYLLDLDSGAAKAITPEGAVGEASMSPRPLAFSVSYDGKHAVVKWKGSWVKWPLEGGEPESIPGLVDDDVVIQWAGDDRHLYLSRPDELRPLKIYLFDLASGRRALWKALGPQDWTGADSIGLPSISRDGKHYAYVVFRNLAELFVVSGLN